MSTRISSGQVTARYHQSESGAASNAFRTRLGVMLLTNMVSRAKVKFVSFQSLAGNYVVIRNKKLHQDYMYAHLATRAPVRKGQIVQPGQQIGIVGQTGDATACHLHFELWLGKWYRGGHPVDPMPYLQTYQGFAAHK